MFCYIFYVVFVIQWIVNWDVVIHLLVNLDPMKYWNNVSRRRKKKSIFTIEYWQKKSFLIKEVIFPVFVYLQHIS